MRMTDLAVTAWSGHTSPETVDVPPGLRVPVTVTAAGPLSRLMSGRLSDAPFDGPDLEIEMQAVYDEMLGRYRVERLRLAAPDGGEVTGTLLRRVPVQTILRWVIPRAIKDYAGTDSVAVKAYRFPEQANSGDRRAGRRGPSLEDLQAVATVYRLAEIASDAPAKAVAEAFRLEKRTATNWILKARESNLLDDDGSAADTD